MPAEPQPRCAALEAATRAALAALAGACELPSGTSVVAACSGGADSVALVHVLAALSDIWPLTRVCFIDHGLRDVAAERRAAAAAAAATSTPFVPLEVTLGPGNVQAAARAARYAALARCAGPEAVVATAHHRRDQAETVLMRLLRGAGLRGLAGIRPRAGAVVRPLLTVSPTTLAAIAGDQFAADPTNASRSYQRNRLRHDVLPTLEAEAAGAEAALARVAGQCRDELALVDALCEHAIDPGADSSGQAAELVEILVRWRLRREAAPDVIPSRGAARALAQQLVAGAARGDVHLGGGVAGQARRGRLSFGVHQDPRGVLVAPSTGSYRAAGLVLVVGDGPDPEPPLTHLGTTWLDPTHLVWPLTLRPASSSGSRRTLSDGSGRVVWDASQRPSAEPAGGLRIRLFAAARAEA